jgi:hypothetical protein
MCTNIGGHDENECLLENYLDITISDRNREEERDKMK